VLRSQRCGSLKTPKITPHVFLMLQLPHRKLLQLDINMDSVTISNDVLGELVELVDQGIKLDIFDRSNNRDFLQPFREGATVESRN